MTVIAALTHEQCTYLAVDSATHTGNRVHDTTRKITRLGSVLIAWAGDMRMNTLTTHRLKIPNPPDPLAADDCDRWALEVAELTTALALDAKPPVTCDDGGMDGAGVLAYRGHLWYMAQNTADHIDCGYTATGSGGDVALGALEVLTPKVARGTLSPRRAVLAAAEAACRWDAYCRPPIDLAISGRR